VSLKYFDSQYLKVKLLENKYPLMSVNIWKTELSSIAIFLCTGLVFFSSSVFSEEWICSEISNPLSGVSVTYEKINKTQYVVKSSEVEEQWEIYDVLSNSALVSYLVKTLPPHQIAILILNKEEESAILMRLDRFDGIFNQRKSVCDVNTSR